jgi:peptidoglycan/LPS O-acetylase OafA/YrhL
LPGAAKSDDRLMVFDAGRGLATSLIVLWHVYEYSTWSPWYPFLYPAWTSVESFFVLSGFLIGGILLDSRESSNYYRTFYLRRVFRILPLYALCLAVFAVAATSGVFIGDAHIERYVGPGISWGYFFTFTQNIAWAVTNPGFTPFWLAPTWTLAIEEQFYLLLPLLLRLTPRARQPAVFLACILVAPFFRFFVFRHLGPTAAYLLFPGQMDTLFIGVLAAWAVRDESARAWLSARRPMLLGALVLLSCGLAWMAYRLWLPAQFLVAVFGVVWLAMFYCVIVYFAATTPRLETLTRRYGRPLAWIGTHSFSIYLFHVGVIATLEVMLPSASIHTRAILLVAILTPAAWCSWRWVERPCIAYSRQRFKYARSAADDVVATSPTTEPAAVK